MYDTTETYQVCLLDFFQCKEEELISKIDAYYHSLEKTEELTTLIKMIHEQTNIPLDLSFYVLFSYDYFEDMKHYLKDSSHYSILYKKIKS